MLGVYTKPNGYIYVGEYKDNMRHGFGKAIHENGMEYEGEFIKGKREGEGKITM